jgi:cellulose synthase/poly-beta-1,6-N-acetylglucosamine synthase-like glycosyltransferase
MIVIFWMLCFLVFYIYFGYPLIAKLLALVMAKKVNKRTENLSDELPVISILIAAYNEADCIIDTLKNKTSLDYPQDKLEILVVSDESEDGTDELVEVFAKTSPIPITLHRQVPRAGKTSGLNLLSDLAKGELFAFSDANSLWDENALRAMVSNFSDDTVGYVTGKMVYITPEGSLVGDGCSSYMKYENFLRKTETLMGSVVGVDGGVDMIRCSLFEKLNADQLPDFVQPLKVVEKNSRVVYEPEAILKEYALNDNDKEYRMRVRVSLRAIWALHDLRHLLNPFKFGLFSFQLISHKLLRYMAFMPLIALLIINLNLINEHVFYALVFVLQLSFYGLAWLGGKNDEKYSATIFTLPYYFTLLNVASAHAFVRYLKREKQAVWKPREG